jgi:predicted transcriptional regulator of viral defense system
VVSTRQLAALGYNRGSASKANGVGRLHRIHRGVYLVGHRELAWEGRCMAAVLAAAPSVASHWSAGWLWGLLRSRPGTLHVTCPRTRRSKRPFVTHTAVLPAVDRAVVERIPVTSVARTILDLAANSRPKAIGRFIERATDEKAFDLHEMRGLLERAKGHKGVPRARAALDAVRPERPVFTRSELERRFLELVRDAGLPEPSMNLFVAGWRSLAGRRGRICPGICVCGW